MRLLFTNSARQALFAVAVICFCLFALTGCEKHDRSTPEGTIAALKETVKEGDPRKVGKFIYASNPDERRLMNRIGVFMGNLQVLGSAVNEKFPQDVAKLKAEVEAAAETGKQGSLLGGLTQNLRPPNRRNRNNRDRAKAVADATKETPSEQRDVFNNTIKQLLSNPYGWLDESEKRLTTEYATDDTVALLWDEKPVFPPVGMVMRKGEDGLWYFQLPTNLPGLNNFMPKNKKQYEVFGSIVATLDNVVKDLTVKVQEGRIRSLDELSRTAGEDAFLPVGLSFVAYTTYIDKANKEAKAAAKQTPAAETPTSTGGK